MAAMRNVHVQVVIGAEHEVPQYSRISLCPSLEQQANFADMDEEYNAAGRQFTSSSLICVHYCLLP